MFHKVKEVRPLSDFRLAVLFESGEQRSYDIRPLFEKWQSFKALSDVAGLFNQIKVDVGGYGISWNDEIDLSCDELYFNGKSLES